MLDAIDIRARTISADALLTQTEFARYLIARGAHYHFTVKGNQAILLEDIRTHFDNLEQPPDYAEPWDLAHGRIEQRRIWLTDKLNGYVKFPHVEQCFMVRRERINKKSGAQSTEIAYGVTSLSSKQASPQKVLEDNRGHWCTEASHYILDWNYDEDRGRIRTGYGPENMTRLRRFAVGLLKSRNSKQTISQQMKGLMLNVRKVLDCLKLTGNSRPRKIRQAWP